MEKHTHHNHSKGEYHIEFSSKPEELISGEPVELMFKPLESHSGDPAQLQRVHEKNMHLLIVSNDLGYFSHQHPEKIDESYVIEHIFPHGGNYNLFVDYSPEDSGQLVSKHSINVGGVPLTSQGLPSETTEWKNNGYTLSLSENQLPFKAGETIEITLYLEKDQRPVRNLGQYLGALAHVVIISENNEEFLHVHPMESEENGPEIKLHTSFPHPGKYKMFVQFKHQEEIHTAALILDVKP